MSSAPLGARERALELVSQGKTPYAAAKAVGVSKTTVGRWLGTVLQEKKVDPVAIREGLQELRERHVRQIAARLDLEVTTAKLKDLKDGYTAYGIADDKLMGRGGGAHATASAFVGLIVVHSDVPRPGVTALPERDRASENTG